MIKIGENNFYLKHFSITKNKHHKNSSFSNVHRNTFQVDIRTYWVLPKHKTYVLTAVVCVIVFSSKHNRVTYFTRSLDRRQYLLVFKTTILVLIEWVQVLTSPLWFNSSYFSSLGLKFNRQKKWRFTTKDYHKD